MKWMLFSLTMALLIGCGSSGFKTADDVVKVLDEYSMVNCDWKMAELIGADSGIGCDLGPQKGSVEGHHVEIYTFDGNAKSACQTNEFCEGFLMSDSSANFHNNVLIYVEGDSNLSEALISSLP